MSEKTTEFLQRADEHIAVANQQLERGKTLGEVSASLMYGSARFTTYMTSTSFDSAEDMLVEKEKIIDYFVKEYKLALEEHLNNFAVTHDFTQNQNS